MHPLFKYDLNGKNYDQNMTKVDALKLNILAPFLAKFSKFTLF